MAAVQFWAGRDLTYTEGPVSYTPIAAANNGVVYGLVGTSATGGVPARFSFDAPQPAGSLVTQFGNSTVVAARSWDIVLQDSAGVPVCRITRLSQNAGWGFNLEEWDPVLEEYQLVAFDEGVRVGSALSGSVNIGVIRWGDGRIRWEYGTYPLSTTNNYEGVTFDYELPTIPSGAAVKYLHSTIFWGVLVDEPDVDVHRYRVVSHTLSTTPTVSTGWTVGQVTGATGYAVGPADVVPATTFATADDAELVHSCTFVQALPALSQVKAVRTIATLSPDGLLDADVQVLVGSDTLPQPTPVPVTETQQMLRYTVDVPSPGPGTYAVGLTLVPR